MDTLHISIYWNFYFTLYQYELEEQPGTDNSSEHFFSLKNIA